MRSRVAWAVAVAIAVAVAVGAVVFVVGRSDPAPSRSDEPVQPRSVANLTCSSPPPPRTPAGERAGFSEGAVLGGREGAPLEAELAGIAAKGARYLRIDVDWSAIEPTKGQRNWTNTDRIINAITSRGMTPL